MYITSPDQLKIFCASLQSSDVLAVDTEFVRERTYFHRVGLIQVGGKDGLMISNMIQVQFMKANNAPLGASLAVSAMGIVSMISLTFIVLNRRWLRKRGS